MQSNRGLSRDLSVASGPFYIASSANRVLKVVGEGASLGSKDGDNKVVVFTDDAKDSDLSSPRDVTVDTSGNVWVVNTGNGRITTYKPDGSRFLAPITASVSGPLGINRDATRVWVANNTGKTVTSYDPASGELDKTISTGSDNPRNLCFLGGAMYVVTEGVGKVDNYSGTSLSYVQIYSGLTSYNDIEVDSSGRIFVMNGVAGRRIEETLDTDVAWYSNYSGPSFLWGDSGGMLWITDSKRFTNASVGNHNYRLIGVDGDSGNGPFHPGIDSNGNIFLNSTSQCSYDVIGRLKPGSFQEEWTYTMPINKSCWIPATGAFASDELGNFYVTQHFGTRVDVVDAAGNRRTIAQQSNVLKSYGSWAEPDGSSLYQAIESHHRLEKVNLLNGARQILPYGLSAAEM